jgi:ribosomal protein S27E
MIVHLVGGSHYLDQEFGELNRIRGLGGDTIYFEKPLSRYYNVDSSIYSLGVSAKDVIMPAVGDTVQIPLTGFTLSSGNANFMYNFGDNIFGLTKVYTATNTGVFKNLGKGNVLNPGDTLKAGAHFMKARRAMIWLHPQKVTINDLTLTGPQPRIFRFDNTYEGRFNRVKAVRNSTDTTGSIYSADFTRDCQFEQCVFASSTGVMAGSQISRSTGDLLFHKCQFVNVQFDISEMSFNTVVDDCDITSSNVDYVVRMGKSTTSSTLKNCRITANNVSQIISMDDIQAITNIQRENTIFNNNIINANNCGSVVYFTAGGRMVISNNTWNGSLGAFTSSFIKQESVDQIVSYSTTEVNNNIFNNTWKSYPFLNGAFNLTMQNNYFKYPTIDTNMVIWSISSITKSIRLILKM